MAPKHATTGTQDRYCALCQLAPEHTTDGPQKREYSTGPSCGEPHPAGAYVIVRGRDLLQAAATGQLMLLGTAARAVPRDELLAVSFTKSSSTASDSRETVPGQDPFGSACAAYRKNCINRKGPSPVPTGIKPLQFSSR